MTFHCYVLLQFSPTFTVVSEAGGTHACVPPAHIGQGLLLEVHCHSLAREIGHTMKMLNMIKVNV